MVSSLVWLMARKFKTDKSVDQLSRKNQVTETMPKQLTIALLNTNNTFLNTERCSLYKIVSSLESGMAQPQTDMCSVPNGTPFPI